MGVRGTLIWTNLGTECRGGAATNLVAPVVSKTNRQLACGYAIQAMSCHFFTLGPEIKCRKTPRLQLVPQDVPRGKYLQFLQCL